MWTITSTSKQAAVTTHAALNSLRRIFEYLGSSQLPPLIFLFSTALMPGTSTAQPAHYASIIIDDLGNSLKSAQQIIALPAPVTLSILPQTTYALDIAETANARQREIMLHLPLQSIENHKASPGTLHLHMTKIEFMAQLRKDIASVPHISGINNHMGSLLTRHPGHMRWLMSELSQNQSQQNPPEKPLFFVDSRTTSQTVAGRIAQEHKIPTITRDVFLDPDHHPDTLQTQFNRFIKIIKQRGYALAIGHPYPETIKFLNQHLDELKQHGIELIPVSQLIQQTGKQYVTCTGTACSGL